MGYKRIVSLALIGALAAIVVVACGPRQRPDTTAPAVAITSPADGATVEAGTVVVTGTASDNVGVTSVQVLVDGEVDGTATLADGNWSYDWDAEAGTYELVARASDAAGNSTESDSVTVTVEDPVEADEEDPVVAITSPANGAILETGVEVVISGTASDNIGVEGVEVFIDDESAGEAEFEDGNWTFAWTPAAEGEYEIVATASDAAGNTGTSSAVSVTVQDEVIPDEDDPVVSITSPLDGATLEAGVAFTITGTATDNVAVTGVEVSINGTVAGSATLTGANWTFEWTPAAGSYEIVATASDAAGNTGSSTTVSVTAEVPDTEDPVVTITSPTAGASFSAGAIIAVSGTASDNVGVTSITVAIGDEDPVEASLTGEDWLIELIAPDIGSYVITATASDAAGNSGSATVAIVVPEEEPPVIVIDVPAEGDTYFTGVLFTVSGTATDNIGVTTVTVEVGGSAPVAATLSGDAWTVELSVSTDGAHTITATASDVAGNTADATVDIDTVPPVPLDAEGAVERVPPLGSGNPSSASLDIDAGGLAAELLNSGRNRGDQGLTPLELAAPNRLIVSFGRSGGLAVPAGFVTADLVNLSSSIDAFVSDYASLGLRDGHSLLPTRGIAVFTVAVDADISVLIASLAADRRVVHVEQDSWVFASARPNDPSFAGQWAHEIGDAQVAWTEVTGANTIRVAVIDTGSGGTIGAESTTGEHPDLLVNLIPGFDFVSSFDLELSLVDGGLGWSGPLYESAKARFPQIQFLDGDLNAGWDAYPVDEFNTIWQNDPSAPNFGAFQGLDTFGGHGTHVAGIVGAVGNNGVGVAGVAWDVQIQPIRVLGHIGSGLSSDVLAGVAYAAGISVADPTDPTITYTNPTPVDVINLSLGGSVHSTVAEELYADVRDLGILVVAAAGNGSTAIPHYPASYPGVVSVSSVDYIHWVEALNGPGLVFTDFFSNFGPTIDISAPGGIGWQDVDAFANWDLGRTTSPTFIASTGWQWFSSSDPDTAIYLNNPILYSSAGTSMAAPYVAGAAALLLSLDPMLDADDLEAILTGTATRYDDSHLPFSYGAPTLDWDPHYGYGVINLPAAVAAVQSGIVDRMPQVTYVEAVNTEDELDVLRVTAEADYSFEIELPGGSWLLRAGVDANGNGLIGDSGEYYGEFGVVVNNQPGIVAGDVSFILERQE